MNAKDVLKLSMLAGEIMLSNGAETYRVEDTMMRIQQVVFKETEVFVTSTGIFSSIEDASGPVCMVKRVKMRTFHLKKVALVNDLSRDIVDGRISFTDAWSKLMEIHNLPAYPLWLRILFSGVACFSFCYIFGGMMTDCLGALITGMVVYWVMAFFIKRRVSGFLVNILCGAVISCMAIALMTLGVGENLDKIIVGAIMPLVPGVVLTNAVRDILEGDFLSGTSRMMDAVIVAVSIATGVGTVLKIWLAITGTAL